MNNSPILILGATGKTGRRIVDRLTASGHRVRSGSRQSKPAFDWSEPGGWHAVLDGVSTVFVRESEGHYRAQAVEIAERTATVVRLARGISPGEIVVVEGAFTLASELEKGELGGGHGH